MGKDTFSRHCGGRGSLSNYSVGIADMSTADNLPINSKPDPMDHNHCQRKS